MEAKLILIEQVINQIKMDLVNGDADALTELLYNLPESKLQGFLPDLPEYDGDGQPDEAQEWYDFDPEC